MRKVIAFLAVVSAFVIGCASFSTNTFRTEQTAVNLAYAGYVGYTQALYSGTLKISADESNAVKQARLKFAASVGVLESWRAAYQTNSALESQVTAALEATLSQSSNMLWLIEYLKAGGK